MKKLSLTICLAITFFVTAAVAQTTPSGGQGSQGSSPSMGQPSQQQPGQPGMSQPDNSTGMGQNPDQNNPNQKMDKEKGEKKLKGCVQSQGGQFVLETKKGKAVALTGQDVSAHVGHEVAVKGAWESGGAGASSSAASSGNAGGAEKTFNVASVDMISESCGGKSSKGESKGGYGSSTGTGSAPSSNPSGTGTSNPPSSTAPPQ